MKRAVFYRLLRPFGRVLVAIFHRRLTVQNRERVPLQGPVVVAANHPNMMLDVLLLASAQPRTLHFLAKATLFANPLLGRFLTAAGVLPVYRRRDDAGATTRNVETFEACHAVLGEGGALAIFPEGVSHERDAVLPLRTGAARIVLEAEAVHGFTVGAVIVPVGLSFSDRRLFRSDALVVFGDPIDPSAHFEPYRNGREREAVRALTAEIETALQRLAPHVPREDDEELLVTLRQFFTDEQGPSPERLVVDRALVDAVEDFRERHPIEHSRLRRQVLSYGRVLSILGVTHRGLERSYRLGPAIRYALPRLILAALGFVPFLLGAALHYLPYKIPGWVARARSSEPVEQATNKLFTGLVTFPVFYGLAALAWGFPYALALLLLGIFCLFYLESMAVAWREVRLFLLHVRADDRVKRLKDWRKALVTELEARRRDYEASLPPLEKTAGR